jgi:hypothetical protein
MDDLRRRHFTALKSAFEFARADEVSWARGARQSYDNQVRLVMDFISRGVPCGSSPSELLPFFLTSSWSGRGDPAGLWSAYAKAGYIDPSAMVQMHCKRGPLRAHARNGFVTLTPLEMAVALENVESFQALLETAHAKAEHAVSRQWKSTKKPMDIFGFIKFASRSDANQARFNAISAKALGALPLELAVFNGDVNGFRARLEAGDSISQVPSRQWDPGARKPMDADGFLKFACKDAVLRVQFEALVANAMMNELIEKGGSVKRGAPVTAPGPTKGGGKRRRPKASKPTAKAGDAVGGPEPQLSLELGAHLDAPGQEAETVSVVAAEQPTGVRSNPRARRAGL